MTLNRYSFGAASSQRLDEGHPDLGLIFRRGISRSSIDFGISQVVRPFAKQLEYFLADPPKTGLDPRVPASLAAAKHVVTEDRPLAMAGDIYIYHPDPAVRAELAYDKASLAYVAGNLVSLSYEMYTAGEVSHVLRWGGNWDQDGVILQDQSFDDMPHFELVTP